MTTEDQVRARFGAALREFRDKNYVLAAASFAEIEDQCPPELATYRLGAKSRRAASLLAMRRWAEALVIYESLAADRARLAAIDRARFPDEVATILWSRSVCLAELGRMHEACTRLADLIEEVGSGTTPVQQYYVAGAYLLQAKEAESRGRFSKALEALDATIAQCSAADDPDDPDLKAILREAERLRQSLRVRVRIHPVRARRSPGA